ncbi:hypothetical protein FRC11_006324 [Ceratobasidium sp. 423]|nr:hypothetical protein FRC11_006324 [Ceratobasidium sp. 423]
MEDHPWPEIIMRSFCIAGGSSATSEKLYGSWNRPLNTSFPSDTIFEADPQFPPSQYTRSSISSSFSSPSLREEADLQLRRRFRDITTDLKTPVLHGVSAFGTKIAFYQYDKHTGRPEPAGIAPDPHMLTDTVPKEWWCYDVLEDEGADKLREVIHLCESPVIELPNAVASFHMLYNKHEMTDPVTKTILDIGHSTNRHPSIGGIVINDIDRLTASRSQTRYRAPRRSLPQLQPHPILQLSLVDSWEANPLYSLTRRRRGRWYAIVRELRTNATDQKHLIPADTLKVQPTSPTDLGRKKETTATYEITRQAIRPWNGLKTKAGVPEGLNCKGDLSGLHSIQASADQRVLSTAPPMQAEGFIRQYKIRIFV